MLTRSRCPALDCRLLEPYAQCAMLLPIHAPPPRRSFPDEDLLKRLTPEDVPEGYKEDKDED